MDNYNFIRVRFESQDAHIGFVLEDESEEMLLTAYRSAKKARDRQKEKYEDQTTWQKSSR